MRDLTSSEKGAIAEAEVAAAAIRLGCVVAYPGNGYVRTTYTAAELDIIAIYCPDLDQVYALPIADLEGQTSLPLRVAPSRNNQALGVKWAAQYEFGAVAQLGERLAGSQKAAGSSPASSTP